MYKLAYRHKTIKFLDKLSVKERKLVIQKFDSLQNNPFTKNLDIKKLTATIGSYRLRVRNIRIIFEVDVKKQIIFIHNADFRGNIYN